MSAPDWSAWLPARPQGVSAAFSAGTCLNMPGHAQACLNTPDLALTFHPDLALTFHYHPAIQGASKRMGQTDGKVHLQWGLGV